MEEEGGSAEIYSIYVKVLSQLLLSLSRIFGVDLRLYEI